MEGDVSIIQSYFLYARTSSRIIIWCICIITLSNKSTTAGGGGILSYVAKWNSWGIVTCFFALQKIPNSPLLSNIYTRQKSRVTFSCKRGSIYQAELKWRREYLFIQWSCLKFRCFFKFLLLKFNRTFDLWRPCPQWCLKYRGFRFCEMRFPLIILLQEKSKPKREEKRERK